MAHRVGPVWRRRGLALSVLLLLLGAMGVYRLRTAHEARWLETVVAGTLGVSTGATVVVEQDQARVRPASLARSVLPGTVATRYHLLAWSQGGPAGVGLYNIHVVMAVVPDRGHTVLVQWGRPHLQLLVAAPRW
jgi:hypothetical protein